jgi:hypothetical protein
MGTWGYVWQKIAHCALYSVRNADESFYSLKYLPLYLALERDRRLGYQNQCKLSRLCRDSGLGNDLKEGRDCRHKLEEKKCMPQGTIEVSITSVTGKGFLLRHLFGVD